MGSLNHQFSIGIFPIKTTSYPLVIQQFAIEAMAQSK